MASINFVQPTFANDTKSFLYSDIHLDIQEQKIYSKSGNTQNISTSDIMLDYDLTAIKNSITNIFNTKKGSRPLYPDWGIDLEQYLFEPISSNTAYKIGKEINDSITLEPRVVLTQINVNPDENINGYRITIALYVPTLSINTTIYATINRERFILN